MRKLVEIKGVGEVLAAAFTEKGFHSVQDIAEATEAQLATVSGVSTMRAAQLIRSAQSLLADGGRAECSSQASSVTADQSPFQSTRELGEKGELPAAASSRVMTAEEPSPGQMAGRANGGSRFEITSSANDDKKELTATGPMDGRSKEESSEGSAVSVSKGDKAKKKNKKKKGAKEKTAQAEGSKSKKNKKKIKKSKKSDSKKSTSKNKKNKKKKDKTKKKKSKSRKKK